MMKKRTIATSAVFASFMLCAGGLIACGDNTQGGGSPENQPVQLSAPVITLTDNVVSWEAVDNATSYDVTVGTNTAVNTTDTTYTISVSESGEYKVSVVAKSTDAKYTVSAKSNTVTYTYTAQQNSSPLVRLEAVTQPTKTVYYLDEKATTVDLSGLSLRAVYDDESEKAIPLTSTSIEGTVDLATVGEKQVNVAYEENSVKRTARIIVTVKERTAADLDADGLEYISAENAYDTEASYYKISDEELTAAVDMKGNTVEIYTEGGKSYVPASLFTKSGSLLIKADDSFINVVAAKFISSRDDFLAIAEDLDGYYVLTDNISLEGTELGANGLTAVWSKGVTPIGQVPLTGKNDEPILALTGEADLQEGRPFTGTFDGKGYIIADMLVYNDFDTVPAWRYDAYHKAMFAYIGETGVVKNFTLRSALIRGGQSGAFVAGVNMGTIQNIVIDETCEQFINYGGTQGYIAGYNGGTVMNTACYSQNFTSKDGTLIADNIGVAQEKSGDEKESNNFIGSTADNTTALGAGWFHIDGYGTVYGNDSYNKLVSYDKVWYVGQTAQITVYKKTGGVNDLTFNTWGIAGYNTDNPAFTVQSTDTSGKLVLTVTWASGIDSTKLPANSTFTLAVGTAETGWFGIRSITIGAPYITGINSVVTSNISCATGDTLSLGNIELEVEMSDGTTSVVNPTEVRNLDTSTAGAKNVVFVWSSQDGREYTINGTVNVQNATGAITASLKAGVDKVILPYSATEGWKAANVTDWSQFFDISETGCSVSITGDIYGEDVTFTISKDGFTSATVTADCYLGVDSAAAWAAINDNLAGWYILTNDVDFANGGTMVGAIPLNNLGDGTEFDKVAPNLAAQPFTGVFNGNNHTLSNYYIHEPFELAFTQDYFGCSLFACIGETGKVYDFTLSGAKINSANYSSFIAGYNKGEISGVTITADCTISANWNTIGAFACFNDGTVKDSVCYQTETKSGAALAATSGNAGDTGTVTNAVVTAVSPSGSSL